MSKLSKERQRKRRYRDNLAQSYWLRATKARFTLDKPGFGYRLVLELLVKDHSHVVAVYGGLRGDTSRKMEELLRLVKLAGITTVSYDLKSGESK